MHKARLVGLKKEIKSKIDIDGRAMLQYDIDKYDLPSEIKRWFACEDLTQIHNQYESDFDVLTFETDQSTVFHKKFYSMPHDSSFYKLYEKFVYEQIQPLFLEEIIFQKIPTFRTQVPNNVGVAEWHKDSDYNHDTKEINIFVPLTKAWDTNTVWAESRPGKKDYTPMNADVGQFYLWMGSQLNHGNKVNQTGLSRMSIDFRVMPLSDYTENDRTSTSNNTKMTLGNYFKKMELKR